MDTTVTRPSQEIPSFSPRKETCGRSASKGGRRAGSPRILRKRRNARFSPDGKALAFTANYEGQSEVYTMPSTGGLPLRRTFGGGQSVGWTPDGRVIVSTSSQASLPDAQLVTIGADNQVKAIPLSQASQGVYDSAGKTLYFTRLRFQGSHAKRYKGGTAQKLWKFTEGAEATSLTADYDGTSRTPCTGKVASTLSPTATEP